MNGVVYIIILIYGFTHCELISERAQMGAVLILN